MLKTIRLAADALRGRGICTLIVEDPFRERYGRVDSGRQLVYVRMGQSLLLAYSGLMLAPRTTRLRDMKFGGSSIL